MSSNVSATPSQYALLGSTVIYSLIFYFITPRSTTPARFAKNREAISVFHCTLVTVLALTVLRNRYEDWAPPSILEAQNLSAAKNSDSKIGQGLPIIEAKSSLANVLTAIETGYLLQDSIILILGARLRSRHSGGKGLMKELNLRVLAWHHAGIASALGLLQWYIARGKEKGMLLIVMFFLMNAS